MKYTKYNIVQQVLKLVSALRFCARVIVVFAFIPLYAIGAEDLEGKVIRVADGDTFTLLLESKEHVNIRLAEIDAPENGQPYGRRSRQTLQQMVIAKRVSVEVQTTDRYGRTVGIPYVEGVNVCEEMVRKGAAWVYQKYLRDKNLLEIESEARSAGRGLWSLSEVKSIPPWEWRARPVQALPADGCHIKGNIGRGGKRIYHLPDSRQFNRTKIDLSKGERWFCSEKAARAAGWESSKSG